MVRKQYFAHDDTQQVIHIRDARKGTGHYYCIGCGSAMVAAKGQVNQHHFRHHSPNQEQPCTYADESYLHRRAKEKLLARGWLRVPAVYQRVPASYVGRPPKLQEAGPRHAERRQAELAIYEDNNGQVSLGPSSSREGLTKRLLFRPDVTFCDQQGKPTLFIEICVRHAVDEPKQALLHWVGVDTVEVRVPPSCHPDELDHLFITTRHTHWLYNHERATTPLYTGPASPGSAGITDDEGELPDGQESIECRIFRLRQALRGARNCLATAPTAGGYFGAEAAVLDEQERAAQAAFTAAAAGAASAIRAERSAIEEAGNRLTSALAAATTAAAVEEEASVLDEAIEREEPLLRRAYQETDEEVGKRAAWETNRRVAELRKHYRGTVETISKKRSRVDELHRPVKERYTRLLNYVPGRFKRVQSEFEQGLEKAFETILRQEQEWDRVADARELLEREAARAERDAAEYRKLAETTGATVAAKQSALTRDTATLQQLTATTERKRAIVREAEQRTAGLRQTILRLDIEIQQLKRDANTDEIGSRE